MLPVVLHEIGARGGCEYQPKLNQNQRKPAEGEGGREGGRVGGWVEGRGREGEGSMLVAARPALCTGVWVRVLAAGALCLLRRPHYTHDPIPPPRVRNHQLTCPRSQPHPPAFACSQ